MAESSQEDCGNCANCTYGTKILDGRPPLDPTVQFWVVDQWLKNGNFRTLACYDKNFQADVMCFFWAVWSC